MRKMRRYQVNMRPPKDGGQGKVIEVKATDVELDNVEGQPTAYWNFTADAEEGDPVTVAAFPWTNVEYIASVPE